MDLFDKSRNEMQAEFKTSFKWVVLAAVLGLVAVLTYYVLVVMA